MGEEVRLILIRHGETSWNATSRLQGVTDTELTATGRLQAVKVGQAARNAYTFNRIWSSDLTRALDTAREITSDDRIQVDARLKEFDLGIFAGHTQEQARVLFPEEWKQYVRDDSYVVPNGESQVHFRRRIKEAILDICKTGEVDGVARSI